MKYNIIAGVNFPHRLETGKTSAEVDAWCKENNHVRLNRDRQIGNYTAEAVVVPRMVYEHRADLQSAEVDAWLVRELSRKPRK